METQTPNSRNGTLKDVHAILTERVIEQLKKGIVPWRVSWTKAGIPENLISHQAYRGINRILLASLAYERNLFLTSKQLKEIGGTLIPDEKPHVVFYLSDGNKPQAVPESTAPSETTGSKKGLQLRYYTVFNIAQCAFKPETVLPDVNPELFPIQKNVEVKAKDQKFAYYDPMKDFINMPGEKNYGSKEERLFADFHQMMHSTGYHSRLNRQGLVQMSEFGYDQFSQEELIAEMGTSFLMSYHGIDEKYVPAEKYLQGWIRKLEDNKWLMYSSAHQAEKAINFLFLGEVEPEDMKNT